MQRGRQGGGAANDRKADKAIPSLGSDSCTSNSLRGISYVVAERKEEKNTEGKMEKK